MEEDITTDLLVLQSHLDNMLERVHHNSLTLKRFQVFERELLRLNSLSEMIKYLLHDAKAFFNLDVVSLCLLDEKGEIACYLEEEGCDLITAEELIVLQDKQPLQELLGASGRTFLGPFNARGALFFPGQPQLLSVAIIPLNRRDACLGSLNFGSRETDRFLMQMATDFVDHLVSLVSICLENHLNVATMCRNSLIDPLTGVNNRLFLDQRIMEELGRNQRNRRPLSCLFIDLDDFKSINDNNGHQAGDEVLGKVAGSIKNQLRNSDVFCRYGGEEFVVLLADSDQHQAYEIAERIRAAIKQLVIEYNERVIKVTISIGLATYSPGPHPRKLTGDHAGRLLRNADSALYVAKRNGRDRVEIGSMVLDDDDDFIDSQIA